MKKIIFCPFWTFDCLFCLTTFFSRVVNLWRQPTFLKKAQKFKWLWRHQAQSGKPKTLEDHPSLGGCVWKDISNKYLNIVLKKQPVKKTWIRRIVKVWWGIEKYITILINLEHIPNAQAVYGPNRVRLQGASTRVKPDRVHRRK